jgi:hypothetical protein
MLDVSVPCRFCSTPIRFRDRNCPGCRVTTSKDVTAILHARLEASSSEFRELKARLHSAGPMLLIVAAIEFGYDWVRWLKPALSMSASDPRS